MFMSRVRRVSALALLAAGAFQFIGAPAFAQDQTPSDCLIIYGEIDKVIENISIENCPDAGIRISNSRGITVRNVSINGTTGSGIFVERSEDITIEENTISNNVTGVYTVFSTGVTVQCNSITNPRGPVPHGQFVQFDKAIGRNTIACNWGRNEAGAGLPEDAINLYQSVGAADGPIVVRNNFLVGGGPSESGGGIMLGDGGGAYQDAFGNLLIDPGQYGIGVASGENMSVTNNTVIAKSQPFTNVGIYVWNQYATACAGVEVSGNRVSWVNRDGVSNPYWDGANCEEIATALPNDFSYDQSGASLAPPAECQCEIHGWRDGVTAD